MVYATYVNGRIVGQTAVTFKVITVVMTYQIKTIIFFKEATTSWPLFVWKDNFQVFMSQSPEI
jgi:hypothetical protein